MKKALIVLQKVKGDNSVHQITDRLYVGSLGAALNVPELEHVGITHILCTATGVRSMYPERFVYKTLTVLDSQMESLLDHFADSIYWIERALREKPTNKVLVHCFAGRSRSVAVILAYLIYKLRVPLSVALLHVKQFRASANPNSGFLNQLRAFEYELFNSTRSFSFDTLHSDLMSLTEPAKLRLKNMQPDSWQHDTSLVNGVNTCSAARSNSLVNPALHGKDVATRSKSSDAVLGVVVNGTHSDSSTIVDGEASMKAQRSRTCGFVAAWFLVILLAVTIVVAERFVYSYYYEYVCASPILSASHTKLCSGRHSTSPTVAITGIGSATTSFMNQVVKYIGLWS